MNVKKIAPLLIAVVLGLLAAKMALNVISKRQSDVATGVKRPQIVIAKANIDAGEQITEENTTLGELSTDVVPDSVFKSQQELVGRVATVPVIQGQAITTTLLAPKGSGPGLQSAVPMGMRAITLEINEFSGVAGFVQAGCHVDILQTLRDEKSGNPIARTIAQNVKVTAIGIRHVADGNADSNNGGGGRSATLLVTPAQAEVLELASMSGRPRLTLRGSNDLAPAWTKGISLNELVGDSKADTTPKIFLPTTQPTVQATTRPYDNDQWTMEIVRGAAQTSVKFTIPKGESESKIDFNK